MKEVEVLYGYSDSGSSLDNSHPSATKYGDSVESQSRNDDDDSEESYSTPEEIDGVKEIRRLSRKEALRAGATRSLVIFLVRIITAFRNALILF